MRNLAFALVFFLVILVARLPFGRLGIWWRLYCNDEQSSMMGMLLGAPILVAGALYVANKLVPNAFLAFGLVFVLGVPISLLLMLAGLFPPEGRFVVAPEIDTVAAPGFTDAAFSKVQLGATSADVLARLGQPLSILPNLRKPGEPELIWYYTQDGGFAYDFAWHARTLGFTGNKVVSKHDYWACD